MKNYNFYFRCSMFAMAIAPIASWASAKIDLKKVAKGNLTELNRSFEKLPITDGAEAEDLTTAIGKSIRANPTNFLIAFKKHKKTAPRIDMLVANLGPEYADNSKKLLGEVNGRIKALKSAQPSLKPLATKCIRELNDLLKMIKTTET